MTAVEPDGRVAGDAALAFAGAPEEEHCAVPAAPYAWPGPLRLKVAFRQRAERGDIGLTLRAGRQSVTLATSDWACPYGQIMRWLEAVVTGVDECACSFDSRGFDPMLKFERVDFQEDLGFLSVGSCWEPSRAPVFAANVGRAQMVMALYRSFVRFTESPAYDPLDYEAHTVGEHIEFAIRGEAAGAGLLEMLVHAGPRDVEAFLERSCPLGAWEASAAIPEAARWARLFSSCVEQAKGRAGPWPIAYKSHWNGVAASLAGKSEHQRRGLIRAWLAESTVRPAGGRLRTLRSPVIERFFAERYPAAADRKATVQSLYEARRRRAAANQEQP